MSDRCEGARRCRRPHPALLSAGVLCLVLGACGRAPPDRTAGRAGRDPAAGRDRAVGRDRAAGVRTIVSAGVDRPLSWRFERRWVFRLPGPSRSRKLRARDVAGDPAGRAYVLDERARWVLVLDSAGAVVDSLGGAGGGVGGGGTSDLVSPVSVTTAPDGTVVVYDAGRGALVEWGAGRVLLPRVRLGVTPERPNAVFTFADGGLVFIAAGASDPMPARASGLPSLRASGADSARGSTATSVRASSAASAGAPGRRLVVWTNDAARTIAAMPPSGERLVEFPACGVRVAVGPIFSPGLLWAARGSRVAVSTTADYTIRLFTGTRHRMTLTRPIAPGRATEALALRMAASGLPESMSGCALSPAELVRRRGYAKVLPVITGLALAPDGSLWVRRRGRALMAVDVFDRAGAYVGTLPAHSPFPVRFTGADLLLTLEAGPPGGSRLVEYRVVRP